MNYVGVRVAYGHGEANLWIIHQDKQDTLWYLWERDGVCISVDRVGIKAFRRWLTEKHIVQTLPGGL